MNSTRSLRLIWTPWSIALTVIVLVVVAAVCYISWRRRGSKPVDGLLELLRFGLVAPVSYTHLTLPTICSV